MNSERNRLRTFSNWLSSAPVDPTRIAKAGFYYTGVGLEVQCFACAGKISHWNYGDQVMWRHRQLKPDCVFVLNPTDSGNIPLLDAVESNDSNDSAHWHGENLQSNEDSGPRDYGLTEEDEMYRCDALRLLSFCNWDDSNGSRQELVNAGFYHAGEGRLRCAWCGGELHQYQNFGVLGNAVQIHRMFYPRCDHAATLEAAQRSNSINLSPPSSPPSDTPPIRSPATNSNETESSVAAHNSQVLNSGSTWRSLGVVGSGPRHYQLVSLNSRLETFSSWPSDRTQLPKAMAEAGFFYTGVEDQVRCFYCDGGLGRWEAGDAPWSEHARWFSTCGYVLLVKGQKYVDECRQITTQQTTVETVPVIRRNLRNDFPIANAQVVASMETPIALAALSAGLDVSRVRRAIVRRLRALGTMFPTSEALIDAVLNDQLNEESWNTQSERIASEILGESLQEFHPLTSRRTQQQDLHDCRRILALANSRSRTPSPSATTRNNRRPHVNLNATQPNSDNQPDRQTQSTYQTLSTSQNQPISLNQVTNQNQLTSQNLPTSQSQLTSQNQSFSQNQSKPTDQNKERQKRSSETDYRNSTSEDRNMALEEENRQLKEARMCKVCMDNEVSVVFLPCGHLVSCAGCGAALLTCPMCRMDVRALVRAYLA